MTSVVIFIISGLAIVTLITSKSLEEKRKKPFLISTAISKGDIQIRNVYHKTLSYYSEGKERFIFLCKKRIPIHSRNIFNKISSYLKERKDQYTLNLRNSKLLKKQDGISEFIKSMSDVEKGNGAIHDVYEDSSQKAKKELE